MTDLEKRLTDALKGMVTAWEKTPMADHNKHAYGLEHKTAKNLLHEVGALPDRRKVKR